MDNKPEVLTTSVHCGQGAVRSIRYNVDGNYCITCGSDKSIKLWNPLRGIQIKTYTGTGNEVLDCASSSDNAQLVAGGLDRCLNIIDVETGKMLRRWRAHAAKVNAVAFNEESNVAFSASMDCTIQAFDARSRSEKPVQIFNEATDSVLSIEVHGTEIVAASADSHFRVYNVRNGSMTEDFMGDSVSCARFTPDAACVLVSTLRSPLRLIDKNDGKLLMSYKGHVSSDILLESVPLHSMDFVASGSEDGNVYVYGVLDGSIAARLDHGGERKIVHSLACHPKKNHLLSTDGVSLFLWTPRGSYE